MVTLDRTFYLQPATAVAGAFLGKVLVHETQWGRLSGVICDVEAYPAFVDGVHHGNKRTKRSEVMWQAGGRAYVYLIYGMWNQLAAVVNIEGVPDVVFIRAIAPLEGIEVMAAQWPAGRAPGTLSNSPGKLCRSMLVTTDQYGADLCGDVLFIEDRGIVVPEAAIRSARRVGITTSRQGFDAQLRHFVSPADLDLPKAASSAPGTFAGGRRPRRPGPPTG